MNAQVIKAIVDELFNLLEAKLKNRFLLLMGLHAMQAMVDSVVDEMIGKLMSRRKGLEDVLDADTVKMVIDELFTLIESKFKGRFFILMAINAIQAMAENMVDQILEKVKN